MSAGCAAVLVRVSVARHANILTRLEYGIVRHVEIAVMVYMSEKSDSKVPTSLLYEMP